MTRLDYAAIRTMIPIHRVLELIDYQPTTRRGQQWRGPCPLGCLPVTRRSRHFSVHLGRSIFQCFHCGSCGNQLDLWSAITGLKLRPATLDLCHRLHIAVKDVQNKQLNNGRF